MGVGREVKGVMVYSSLERCETLITRKKKPVALFVNVGREHLHRKDAVIYLFFL